MSEDERAPGDPDKGPMRRSLPTTGAGVIDEVEALAGEMLAAPRRWEGEPVTVRYPDLQGPR
ncbi:MAG: hypothetical protein ACRD0K_15435 [Egibacteraceae bacterium]